MKENWVVETCMKKLVNDGQLKFGLNSDNKIIYTLKTTEQRKVENDFEAFVAMARSQNGVVA